MGARGCKRTITGVLIGILGLLWASTAVERATAQLGGGGVITRAATWIFATGTDIRPVSSAQTASFPTTWTGHRWYNVESDASNYERGIARWSSNDFQIGTQSDGSGVARDTVVLGHGSSGLRVTATRHLESEGTAPAIRGPCGTTPAIAGTDAAGKLTLGTGTPGGFCELHFVNAWQNPPACVAVNETTANAVRVTTTAGIVTFRGTFAASDVLAYVCLGRR